VDAYNKEQLNHEQHDLAVPNFLPKRHAFHYSQLWKCKHRF